MQCTLMVPEAINEEVLADVLCKELQDSQLRGGLNAVDGRAFSLFPYKCEWFK